MSGRVMSRLGKFGVVLLLLVLICGPLLQIYDCFNDSPTVDHDSLLHSVDALFCIIIALIATSLWALVFAILQLAQKSRCKSVRRPTTQVATCYLDLFYLSPHPIRI
jgi:hypothetical protein